MDVRDREAIEGLFAKLDEVERQAGPRDAEAERLIAERVRGRPAAPYYLAQTVVMQDAALTSLQARIDELEKAAKAPPPASENGGFLSRLPSSGPSSTARTSVPGIGARGPWGQAEPQPGAPVSAPAPQAYAPAPAYPQQPPAPPQQGFGSRMGGGGFLAGAAQTAMGVAGGVVLGNALGSMPGGHGGLFGGGFGGSGETTEVTENVTNIYEAPQEAVQDVADAAPAEDAGYQDASYDDPGGNDGFAADDGGFDDI